MTHFNLSILLLLTVMFPMLAQAEIKLDQIKLPAGFKISVFAKDLKGARSMTWGDKGTLFVGTRDEGIVYAIEPSRKVTILAKKLNEPNGVAFKDGALYVAEIHRVLKFEAIESALKVDAPFKVIAEYPKDGHHGWKFIAFGPDGKLYVPVGAPCNICESKDPYASITTITSDGKNREVFARGVRNTVGFDWHPTTKELWFTDNGRDWVSDELPPDELNRAPQAGLHFGYPYCHAGEYLDSEFGKDKKCSDYQKPEKKLGPHVAALGMRFYSGKTFPEKYRRQIFIAEHGSWNRSKKLGYRVMLVTLDPSGKAISYEPFAEGWLQKEKAWGRPVDVINVPDGSLLVSDDEAGAIYKIQYAP